MASSQEAPKGALVQPTLCAAARVGISKQATSATVAIQLQGFIVVPLRCFRPNKHRPSPEGHAGDGDAAQAQGVCRSYAPRSTSGAVPEPVSTTEVSSTKRGSPAASSGVASLVFA